MRVHSRTRWRQAPPLTIFRLCLRRKFIRRGCEEIEKRKAGLGLGRGLVHGPEPEPEPVFSSS